LHYTQLWNFPRGCVGHGDGGGEARQPGGLVTRAVAVEPQFQKDTMAGVALDVVTRQARLSVVLRIKNAVED